MALKRVLTSAKTPFLAIFNKETKNPSLLQVSWKSGPEFLLNPAEKPTNQPADYLPGANQ